MDAPFHRWPAAVVLLTASLATAREPEAAYRFRFETPAVQLTETDAGQAISAEGFSTHARQPGAPDVPWKTVLVAIPPGAEPRLRVVAAGASERFAVRPRPIPTIRPLAPPDESADPLTAVGFEQIARPDGAAYAATQSHPPRVAWLGRQGVLRDQAYVELHLAPIRYEPGSTSLVRDAALDVTVEFGTTAAEVAAAPADPVFEPIYRNAFVNYAQGRAFRLSSFDGPASGGRAAPAGAATPQRKIVVREAGVVRLDHAYFAAHAPEFLAYAPSSWKLASRGVQVPLHLEQSGVDPDGLEPGEWVQFWGQALDDEPAQVLNTDTGGLEDLYEVRDYSDENVYFLSIAAGAQPQMAVRASSPGLATPPADFPATARREVNDVFFPLAGGGIEYWLPLLSESAATRSELVPLDGLAAGTLPVNVRVSLRGVSQCDGYTPDHASRVELRNDSSQTLVLPPGPNNSGNQNLGAYDGQTSHLHDIAWTHSGSDPTVSDPLEVHIQVDNIPGNCPTGGVIRNDVLLDWIEVDYRRVFVAAGDGLRFAYPDADADFTITGLASGSGAVHVYEVTKQLGASGIADTVRVTGAEILPDGSGGFQVRFHMADDPTLDAGTLRRFVVAGAGAIGAPDPSDFRRDRISTLLTDTTQADLLVVAHPDLLDSSCSSGGNPCSYDADCTLGESDRCEIDASSGLAQYLAHRQAQGTSARVVRIGDVQDELNHGLAGPLGIRNLVGSVLAGGWGAPAPAYLLLLGDATYLPKSPTSSGNYVPTQVMIKKSSILSFYASDNLLGNAAGAADQLADLAVGRISVRTLAEAESVLAKIVAYEQAPAGGDWRSNALFISDRANDFGSFEALEFERINDLGAAALDGTAYTSQQLRYWTDYCVPSTWTCTSTLNVCTTNVDCPGGGANVCRPNCDVAGMRSAIKNAVNGLSGPGAAVLQFMGHGNFDWWSSDKLFCGNDAACASDDTLALVNDEELPWVIVHNCLSGGFHSLPPKSLGEQWLKRDGGGAAAVFAPSGLGFRFLGEGVSEVIWDDLFGAAKERALAVPVHDSLVRLCTQDSIEGCQFYTLLGDPSMTLRLPDVAPPEDAVAVGDNGVVHLSWTASTSPGATYDVWRTTQLIPPYTLPFVKLNEVPIPTPSYDDTNVMNLEDYFYYVVAVNPDGFESRWSNFNTDCVFADPDCEVVGPDCPVLGPDCLVGVPINFVPPSTPTGLEVVDAESGGRLELSWHANLEDDIDHYTVHYGLTPQLGEVQLAYANKFGLNGLTDGLTYYIAISATNTTGVSSPQSPITTGVPSLVLGVRSPGLIEDLLLARSGDDALLLWGEVTEDIYGKPIGISEYEIFGGSTVGFVPAGANLLGSTPNASWIDPGQLAGGPSRFYLVRGVDALANPGGLGRQLPNGTTGLDISRSTRTFGNIVLSWPAVTTDFDGNPTSIAGYEVYSSSQPFDRQSIASGAVGPPLWSGAATSVELTPPGPTRYYSVIAVDSRGNRSPF